MKPERIAIYGNGFPTGFTRHSGAVRCLRDNLTGLPKSYFPRAPREGEMLVNLRVDPNGVPFERGDVILRLAVKSQAHPELAEPHDYEVVQIKARFTQGDCGFETWHRYVLLRAAKPKDVEHCLSQRDTQRKKTANWAMTS